MNKNKELTAKQRKVFEFIRDKIRSSHIPPTVREIASRFGFSSTGTVRDYLNALIHKGYIKISAGKSRAIELLVDSLYKIPILGRVQAGVPNLAVEDIEGYLDLDRIISPDNHVFALRIKGDSMIEAGIMPGDFVLVKRQNIAQVGEVVVALKEDEATIKTLKKRGQRFFLEPSNDRYKPILVDESISIIGKVINVIRKYF